MWLNRWTNKASQTKPNETQSRSLKSTSHNSSFHVCLTFNSGEILSNKQRPVQVLTFCRVFLWFSQSSRWKIRRKNRRFQEQMCTLPARVGSWHFMRVAVIRVHNNSRKVPGRKQIWDVYYGSPSIQIIYQGWPAGRASIIPI